MPLKYRKHYAYKTRGDYTDSYICVCLRQSHHLVAERKETNDQVALFDITARGEMVR